MALSHKARKRWSLVILLVWLPLFVVVAVTLVNWLGARFGRLPILAELVVYVGLGFLWALPFKRVFRGIGQADFTHPHEHQAVALQRGVAAHPRLRRHGALAWHVGAHAVGAVAHAVVGADHFIATTPPQ